MPGEVTTRTKAVLLLCSLKSMGLVGKQNALAKAAYEIALKMRADRRSTPTADEAEAFLWLDQEALKMPIEHHSALGSCILSQYERDEFQLLVDNQNPECG